MTGNKSVDSTALFLDKAAIRRTVREQNKRAGFTPDPAATARKAQEMALSFGIRPEDNLFSCGIMAARDEE